MNRTYERLQTLMRYWEVTQGGTTWPYGGAWPSEAFQQLKALGERLQTCVLSREALRGGESGEPDGSEVSFCARFCWFTNLPGSVQGLQVSAQPEQSQCGTFASMCAALPDSMTLSR